jgi:hypothetical protein
MLMDVVHTPQGVFPGLTEADLWWYLTPLTPPTRTTSMNNLPTYSGNKFRWNGYVGMTNQALLGTELDYGYVGYFGDLGFAIESHLTGVKKLFLYTGSVHDDDMNFIGTRWETCDGISVVICEE